MGPALVRVFLRPFPLSYVPLLSTPCSLGSQVGGSCFGAAGAVSLLGPGAAGAGLLLGSVAGSRRGADVTVDERRRASSSNICACAEPANEMPLLGSHDGSAPAVSAVASLLGVPAGLATG